jgi:hypothetical protein
MAELSQDQVDQFAEKLSGFYDSLGDDEREVFDVVLDQAAGYPEVTGHGFLAFPNPTPADVEHPRPNPVGLQYPRPNPTIVGIGGSTAFLPQGLVFPRPGGRESFIIG